MIYTTLRCLSVISLVLLGLINLKGQDFELSSKLEGIDGTILSYKYDFSYAILADGEILGIREHKPSSRISDDFVILIKDISKYTSITTIFTFNDYEPVKRTIRVDNKRRKHHLGTITPKPNPVIISDVLYYPSSEQDSLIEFLITFRNSSGNMIKMHELELSAEVEPNCSTPSPIFASVKIDKSIKFDFTSTKEAHEATGSASDLLYNQTSDIVGEVYYDECTLHRVNLKMSLPSILPGELYSQMRIQMPNNLSFYSTKYSSEMDYKLVETINEMDEILRKIPNVIFSFSLDLNGQEYIATSRAQYRF